MFLEQIHYERDLGEALLAPRECFSRLISRFFYKNFTKIRIKIVFETYIRDPPPKDFFFQKFQNRYLKISRGGPLRKYQNIILLKFLDMNVKFYSKFC